MKKIVAIFVALLLLFNTVGMLVFYWGEMERCEDIAFNKIAHHDFSADALIQFSSANEDFQIIEGKEILNNGILYDIVKIEIKNGITFYSCFSDKKETGFWNGISQLVKGNSDHSATPIKDNAPEVLKYISQDKTFAPAFIFKNAITDLGFRNNNFYYKNPYCDISSPPPKV